MNKKPELVFMPGCFDNFEGTQEELDELVAQIKALAESGELLENAVILDEDSLQDFDFDQLQIPPNRTLQ